MALVLQRRSGTAKYFTQALPQGPGIDMVYISGGSFLMGSPDTEEGHQECESPQHTVTVPAFFMGKYPITQAQWKAVADHLPQIHRKLSPKPSYFEGNHYPVESVSWHDAIEFCARLSKYSDREYSLPSEAQWEYACRAGTTTPFHFGETIGSDIANYRAQDWKLGETTYSGKYGQGQLGEFRNKTTPVGSFKIANAFGLYDMHGNVWEWCLDYWHETYEGAPVNGSAWCNSEASENAPRVLRGGSWFDLPRHCRSASRIRYDAVDRNLDIGFRVISHAGTLL
ncbi:formylglycine-generating enzyme family protein [Alkalinema sp. FACHB-956]|uniref:formylglycine-generating enzyme family protein n=1 Tax=Alkalinema sp. FACHB-956 TaxID=2692768 RepID=UPI001687D6E7|nr:formylglycine-generating enzyme family protein [Alkalinema sp. FACHB-956]MBD2325802.1 formylglycine-generating enzyme family protein [Alkalinema sp. FACHB-956]